MKRLIRIDKDQLEDLAEVKFDWSDIAWLVRFTSNYAERFSGPLPPNYLLAAAWDQRREPKPNYLTSRRAFVMAVEDLWRERWRSRKRGWTFNRDTGESDGPLIRLLMCLFEAAGDLVPADTIADDLMTLRRGERKHKKKRKSAPTLP